ncbi:MAG: hypothetical protein RLZZ116_688 [Planctomycetota bacterium]|jgi:hypothetical protein
MKLSRIAWTLWALIPVGLLAFHFGPGQAAYREDKAAKLVAKADSTQQEALVLQSAAYEKHLAAIAARVAAFGNEDEALRNAAAKATAEEEAAYAQASAAWKVTADALAEAQAYVDEIGGPVREEIRLAKARALVRTGDVAAGANELEDLLYDAGERDALDSTLALKAREELATAYYYGARLMRLAGKPADEWREVASRARQNFRYLAEDAKARGASSDEIANHEKNGELVLNLEQSSLDELYAKPRPKDSPTGKCNGLGQKPRPGNKGRNQGQKPAKGAGMNGEIGNGW